MELLKTCKKLNETLGYEVSPMSMIKVCLLVDVGRIGDKHNDRFIEMYLDNLDKILKIISYCENNDQDINKYLDNKVSKKDFYRYN